MVCISGVWQGGKNEGMGGWMARLTGGRMNEITLLCRVQHFVRPVV